MNRKLIAWGFILTGLISLASWAWGRWHIPVGQAPVGVKTDSGREGFWGTVKITYTITPKSPAPIGVDTISALQNLVDKASGQYGIYVYRLADRLGYGISSDKVFPAASIMKVPIMVATYRKIESGEIKVESVGERLEAMGKRSDNEAPVTLTNMLGRDFIRQTVKDLGMPSTDFDANTTTAYDVAQMWKTLSEGKLITSNHWQQMQQWLSDSIFEERIPAGVPEDVRVVHKVGTDIHVWSDAGIVMTDKPLIIVILNSEVNLDQAKQTVPQLVRIIWSAETAESK